MQAIKLFKGDDTHFNDGKLLVFHITGNTDLSAFSGLFSLGRFKKPVANVDGTFEVVIPAEWTQHFPLGIIQGTFQLVDSKMRVATVSNTIPFEITDEVFTLEPETVELPVPAHYPVQLSLEIGFAGGNYNQLNNKPTYADGSAITGTFDIDKAGAGSAQAVVALQETVAQHAVSISDEQTARENSDNLLQGNLTAEQAARQAADGALSGRVDGVEEVIPNQASAQNQLADKAFVNSSIATNTANFIGTFDSVEGLNAYSGHLTNNDYAFVRKTDAAGNTLYDRYKYNGSAWVFEYTLNNSSFTREQWEAIQSGITAALVTQIGTNQSNIASLGTSKQDVISDLSTIRSGAAAGAAALPAEQKGAALGVATLDSNGQITDGQINYATAARVGGIKQTFDATTGTWTVITEEV